MQLHQLLRIVPALVWIFTSFSSAAQTRLSDIEPSGIKQKSIRLFLKQQQDKGIIFFEDFRPSVTDQTDSSLFDSNVHHFKLRQAQDKAWNAYLSAHPATVWQGKIVSCGLIYSPSLKKTIFPTDDYPGLEVGQIFFIEMRVLCRLVKFPVCFMVSGIDRGKQTISFSYVESGASRGAQTIRLTENRNGETQIIHSSIHLTQNKLRDKTLYPIYHKKAISEVHRNIRRILGQND